MKKDKGQVRPPYVTPPLGAPITSASPRGGGYVYLLRCLASYPPAVSLLTSMLELGISPLRSTDPHPLRVPGTSRGPPTPGGQHEPRPATPELRVALACVVP